jgi:prephenate dehydrogenase
VHKVFMETTNDFNKFVINKDEEWFINTILNTNKYFWENAKKWQIYTDKIIYLISKQVEIIEENIWKEITLINIYSKEKINWIIKKYHNEIIYFKNWEKYDINIWEIKKNT